MVDWPKNEKEWRKMKKEKPLDFIMHKEKIGEQFSIEQNGKLAEDDPPPRVDAYLDAGKMWTTCSLRKCWRTRKRRS